jgi:uncharacterized protein YdaU (DUF1376 family)
MHLTTEEHGAYLLLIFNYWQTGKPIPVSRLARIARLSNERWTDVERSLNEFFNECSGEWVHDRIERDLESVHATQNQRSAAGKASAEARAARAQARKTKAVNARSTTVEIPLNENSTIRDTDTDTDTEETTHTTHASDSPPAVIEDHTARPRFAITDEWEPDPKTFTAVLHRNGMANQTFHADQLLEFRSYWISRPDDLKTQAQWEHALAQQLKRQARTQQAQGLSHETGGRTAQRRTRNAHDILTDPSW